MPDSKPTDVFTLHIDGVPENGKDLRFSVFIQKAEAFRVSLREADRTLSRRQEGTVEFFVVGLRKDNPSSISLSERPLFIFDERGESAFDFFADVVRRITSGDRLPTSVGFTFLQYVAKLVEGLNTKYSRIWFTKNDKEVAAVTLETVKAIDALLGNTITSYGSISGRVEKYNSHGEEKNFYIYPSLGGKVKCIFTDEFLSKASAAVEKFVTVHGTLKTRVGEYHPYELLVSEIEAPVAPEDVPKLSDLYGVAPDATGNESSADFIRSKRDDWH
jgi:hypothetical protein